MTDFIEIKGASGQGYAFRPCVGERLLPATGAVVVAVTRTRRGWEVAGVAETENLALASLPALFEDLSTRRDVRLYFRLNVSAVRRREDIEDLRPRREQDEAVSEAA